MGDFSQNGIISTLHDFGTKSTSVIENELSKFSKQRKMELILPCLYSELEGEALPKIIDEISKTKYLDH
ncbi:glycosyl transferase, partial [Candidatus Pelagibacter sp.]|nr:glycosyl transferase [Candidatus Pelagibacter sp.]